MKTNLFLSFVSILFFALFSSANAATFTVSKTADTADGVCNADCSLREAMTAANDNGNGADTINFDIPGGGVKTIVVGSRLPGIFTSLTINGATQSGYFGKPMIEVNGGGIVDQGFQPQSAEQISVTIIGLAITNFDFYGIRSQCLGRCDITLLGNFIGVDPTGTFAKGNEWDGVHILPSPDSIINIGGAGIFEGNVISGNGLKGIHLPRNPLQNISGTAQVNIVGNKIGTDFNGSVALGNGEDGVQVLSAIDGLDIGVNLTVGGSTPAARNIISGNGREGLYLITPSATIKGNYIGTNAAGTAALPNDYGGIFINAYKDDTYHIGGSGAGEGNLISGNDIDGIKIFSAHENEVSTAQFYILGNYIGTNAAGTAAIPNSIGIYIQGDIPGNPPANYNMTANVTIGGISSGARNIISGNNSSGILIGSGNVSIYNNYIGTDKNGNSNLGNTSDGIGVYNAKSLTIGGTLVLNGTSYDVGNVISGNGQSNVGNGIKLWETVSFDSPVIIRRNRIGTNAAGTNAIPNTFHGIYAKNGKTVIGSDALAEDGNIISGNDKNGIFLDGASLTKVFGNKIGTNGVGGSPIPNGESGMRIQDSPFNQIGLAGNSTASNVISGNTLSGIFLYEGNTAANKIENNYIGTSPLGLSLGNGNHGVFISGPAVVDGASGNFVNGNVIAFNNKTGVSVGRGTINEVRNNSIYSNGELGIDLDLAGVTPNDAGDGDAGANNNQNFPALSLATTVSLNGSLNSTPNTSFDIDFYRVDSCDASGNGEGRYFVGSTTASTDAAGNAQFSKVNFSSVGQVFTATATVAGAGANDTSEFSQCIAVTPTTTLAFSASTYSVNEGAAMRTIVVNRTGGTNTAVTIDYATSNGTATAGQDYTATSGTLSFGVGEVTKNFDVQITNDTLDEADETINLALSNPTGGAFLGTPNIATLTIVDNDTAPTVSITDVSANEGNAGNTSFTFHVQLSAASGFPVSMNFATADGTANLSDYIGLSGTVNFAAGETDKTVTVSVIGDLTNEADETFFVNLSNAVNSTISDTQGIGTIVNDDVAPVSIGGTIRKSDNTPLAGATLQLSGTQTSADDNRRKRQIWFCKSFVRRQLHGFAVACQLHILARQSAVSKFDEQCFGRRFYRDFRAVASSPNHQRRGDTGQNGIITVELVAQGNEHSIAFSLDFDSSLVFNPQVVLGSGAQTAMLVVNNSANQQSRYFVDASCRSNIRRRNTPTRRYYIQHSRNKYGKHADKF